MSNISLISYSTLADLDYFGHKDFEYLFSANIRQALNRFGANYSNKVIKRLQVLVWRASYMKRPNQPLLIKTNLSRDDVDEWYLEAIVELAKIKKEFNIASTGKFVYSEWSKWDKSVINLYKNL